MISPYPGAHIRVQVNGIYHHGIYVNDEEIIQFGLPFDMMKPKEEVRILKSDIIDFLQGGFLEVRVYDKKEKRLKNKDEDIIKIAISKLGEDGYDIVHNNCEHFANYCVFNKKESKQIDDIRSEIRKKLGIKR